MIPTIPISSRIPRLARPSGGQKPATTEASKDVRCRQNICSTCQRSIAFARPQCRAGKLNRQRARRACSIDIHTRSFPPEEIIQSTRSKGSVSTSYMVDVDVLASIDLTPIVTALTEVCSKCSIDAIFWAIACRLQCLVRCHQH